MTERSVFRGVNSINFNRKFKDNNYCLGYLVEVVSNEDGKKFKELPIDIMNIKAWLREIQHHYSKDRMQNYYVIFN